MSDELSTVSLLGESWTITSGEHHTRAALPAHALQALQDAGRVPNPLYRYNERELRWAAEREWVFEREFSLSHGFLEARRVDLLLSGIDTVAKVTLNGKHLISTDNAFREFRIEVQHALRTGSNVLRIDIQPAIAAAKLRADAHPYEVPAQQGPGMAANMNFVRKPQCDFGWDWGPCFAPAGIFGKVELAAYNRAHLTGATTRQWWLADGVVELEVIAQLLSARPGDAGILRVSLPSMAASASLDVYLDTLGEHTVSVKVTLRPEKDQLWWPHGHGRATLHQLEVTFEDRRESTCSVKQPEVGARSSGESGATPFISSLWRTVGLKRVELVREPLAEGRLGETFFFRVNLIPIFIKGSNMIPSDVFRARETPERERALVQAAVDAHMNTMRVWGGGHYPSDAFMAACDEAGILVWLEAMFACALYPREQPFLENVAVEIRQQAFRLAGHVSVLCLGGNNEVENSFGWFNASVENPNLYSVDFDALFVRTFMPAVALTGPDIYLDSSPSNGLFCKHPWVKRWGNTQDPNHGDVHFYDYTGDAFDPYTYPRAKFVSEFGFQSWPSWPGYSRVTVKEDWAWDSPMSEYRQRHPDGNLELEAQLSRHFSFGDALQATESGFRRWIYLTQIQQAMVYDTAVRYWRRIKHEADARTMGTLYWQHNDIWEGPSWSGIDYDGSWKLLHYHAARFYAPFLVSAYHETTSSGGGDGLGPAVNSSVAPGPSSSSNSPDAGTARVFLTSDVPSALTGSLSIEVIPWDATAAPAAIQRREFSLPPLGSQTEWEQDLPGLLNPLNLRAKDAFLRITAAANTDDEAASAAAGGGASGFQSSTECWLSEFKHAAMRDPQLSATDFRQVSRKQVEFRISAMSVAAGVAAETPLAGRFSDNGLLVLPWAPPLLQFYANHDTTAAQVQQSLSLISIFAPASSPSS